MHLNETDDQLGMIRTSSQSPTLGMEYLNKTRHKQNPGRLIFKTKIWIQEGTSVIRNENRSSDGERTMNPVIKMISREEK